MSVVIANTRSADSPPPLLPLRPDNTAYRFEMIFDGGGRRGYADTAEALLGMLIAGYEHLSPADQYAQRLLLAVRTQVSVQADINSVLDLNGCTPDEYAVLQGHRNTAPQVSEWACAVPLVLVDTDYAPYGDLPRPVSAAADVAGPPNLLWLTPAEEYEFLLSLHQVGLIALHAHTESGA
jgi:hypothetical protein